MRCQKLLRTAHSRSLCLWCTWVTHFSRAKYESGHLYSVGRPVSDTPVSVFSFCGASAESISLKRWKSNQRLKGSSYPGIICEIGSALWSPKSFGMDWACEKQVPSLWDQSGWVQMICAVFKAALRPADVTGLPRPGQRPLKRWWIPSAPRRDGWNVKR